jgi:hypothetical protein
MHARKLRTKQRHVERNVLPFLGLSLHTGSQWVPCSIVAKVDQLGPHILNGSVDRNGSSDKQRFLGWDVRQGYTTEDLKNPNRWRI